MTGVERFARFEDAEAEMNQLAHHGHDYRHLAFSSV
jgi:hypothetical protein